VKHGAGSPDEARLEQTPHPIPHPTNGGSYYCRGFKSEQGAEPPDPLTLTTGFSFASTDAGFINSAGEYIINQLVRIKIDNATQFALR